MAHRNPGRQVGHRRRLTQLKSRAERNRQRRHHGIARTRDIRDLIHRDGQMQFLTPRFKQRHTFGAARNQKRGGGDLPEQDLGHPRQIGAGVNRFSGGGRGFASR